MEKKQINFVMVINKIKCKTSIVNLLIGVVCVAPFIGFSQQQAYVYQDSIYLQLKDYKAKMDLLTEQRSKYEKEVQETQSNLNEKAENLLAPYNVKEGETLEQLQARLNAKDLELYKLLQEENKLLASRLESYNKLLDNQYKTDIVPYINLVNSTIEAYALKSKLDYVWDMNQLKGNLVYANKGKNITKTVVEIVNSKLKN